MYSLTTGQITITAVPTYQGDVSVPEENHFVWTYEVVVHNNSADRIQLMSRRWLIIDANGFVTQVEGQGVVGKQPVIEAHASHQYASHVHLRTASGVMCGNYSLMLLKTKDKFDVEVPAFSLDIPAHPESHH
jgi:ApaG protein